MSRNRSGGSPAARRFTTETKAASKTTELIAYVVAVVGVGITALTVDADPNFGAERAWLYIIARRTLANQRRATKRRHALADRLHVSLSGHVESDTRLAEALAMLAEQDREALLLIAWEGLSCDDAARVVGCRAATFRMRLHRARRRLSEHLNDPQAVLPSAAVKEAS